MTRSDCNCVKGMTILPQRILEIVAMATERNPTGIAYSTVFFFFPKVEGRKDLEDNRGCAAGALLTTVEFDF